MERVTLIELEDEDGNIETFRVRKVMAADINDPRSVRAKSLVVRPGGMLVALDDDFREITTPDDAIADAQRRQERELAVLRERGMTSARTGGEGAIVPDEHRTAPSRAPGKRGRRGSSVKGEDAEGSQTPEGTEGDGGQQEQEAVAV